MAPKPPARGTFQRFVQSEAAGGVLLMGSTALALAVANTFLGAAYGEALHARLAGLDVLHWINDGLMALFFLLVGLEIKREMVEGELNSWARRALPLLAALGGMLVPALTFIVLNWRSPETMRGWAIPIATDIAFALGVLSLFGPRVAHSLKVFLTSLAIIDDLGAILIIALFYASDLSPLALALAALTVGILYGLNRLKVTLLLPYLVLGAGLWVAMLFSGIHATLAGVLLAFTIPLGTRVGNDVSGSPLCRLEHALSPWVAFLVLPVFGFANAGVAIGGIGPVIVGSPATVADQLEAWVDDTDIDGFNLCFVVRPETFVDVADLLVPELQRRGRYKRAYAPGTLREKLFGNGSRLPPVHPAAGFRWA